MTQARSDNQRNNFEPYPSGMTPEEKQYPLQPSLLNMDVYRDPQRFRAEMEKILFEAWFPVHPSADVARPNNYVVWEQMGQSVVITRPPGNGVAAWHNVCQHRGARLVDGYGSCKIGKFKCPWHGFVYDFEGRVASVPLRESFDENELNGLRAPRVRVDEWGGWIWLSFSDQIAPLREYLGTIGDELESYHLESFTTQYRASVRLQANWKIVIDAFNETWHVPFTHKDTLTSMVMWRQAFLKLAPPHSWMTIPIRDFTDRARADSDHHSSHLCHHLVFPNTIFSCFPTHLQMWSAWPVSSNETQLCAYQVAGPPPPYKTPEQWAADNKRDWQHFQSVLSEDAEILNNIDRVIGSRGLTRNMFNTAESRLTAFHEQIEKQLR